MTHKNHPNQILIRHGNERYEEGIQKGFAWSMVVVVFALIGGWFLGQHSIKPTICPPTEVVTKTTDTDTTTVTVMPDDKVVVKHKHKHKVVVDVIPGVESGIGRYRLIAGYHAEMIKNEEVHVTQEGEVK